MRLQVEAQVSPHLPVVCGHLSFSPLSSSLDNKKAMVEEL